MINRFDVLTPDYGRNYYDGVDGMPCAICGRRVLSEAGWVWVHGGGRFIVRRDEDHGLDPDGDMGWFPVGRECARKVPGYLEPEPA